MLIWFATMSVVLTWMVFQSPALDYRLVALGAVIPVVEVPFGAGPLHSLAAPTVVLAVTMLLTQKRRMVRRRWLGISIGMYLHLVLDAAFTRSQSFWWPFLGVGFAPGSAPELSRGLLTAGMELVGIGVGMWAFGRFGLDDPARRRKFWRTGQLDRSIMGEAERGC
ncbi:MAG TPA: metal-dependent hydrolase [Microthrixaceae bacterium]|nr:metal-dependent hydrolase [Microthrixaceae bacterium]